MCFTKYTNVAGLIEIQSMGCGKADPGKYYSFLDQCDEVDDSKYEFSCGCIDSHCTVELEAAKPQAASTYDPIYAYDTQMDPTECGNTELSMETVYAIRQLKKHLENVIKEEVAKLRN